MSKCAKSRVIAAALSGYCNTSQDVADETGVSVNQCSSYISALARQGLIKRTGRRLPNSNPVARGRWLRVFEVANA